VYAKTQTVGIIGNAIDTPGEYIQNRLMRSRLRVVESDAGLVFFLQDATQLTPYFSPGQASMFSSTVAGVVTKADLATAHDVESAKEILTYAGATQFFVVSSMTGEGMTALEEFIAGFPG
jgi:ethanolamine utilization protein EutP